MPTVTDPPGLTIASVVATGVQSVTWQAITPPPQASLADDANVSVFASSHEAYTGQIVVNDPAVANSLKLQDGSLDFDGIQSDDIAVKNFTFAGARLGVPSGGFATGSAGAFTIPFASKGLTIA